MFQLLLSSSFLFSEMVHNVITIVDTCQIVQGDMTDCQTGIIHGGNNTTEIENNETVLKPLYCSGLIFHFKGNKLSSHFFSHSCNDGDKMH